MHLHAAPALVDAAARAAGGHRRGRRLDGARVVEGVPAGGEEVGILDLDDAPRRILRAVEPAPGVLDQRAYRLARPRLRADADDLDARDAESCVGRVVALAAAEVVEALGPERLRRPLRTARLLHEGADRAGAEARRYGEARLGAHREDAVRGEQVEPEEDARAARAVDLAPRERGPDRVPVPAGRVHPDEAAGQEERRRALEVEDLERRDTRGRRAGIERRRLDGRHTRRPADHAIAPDLVPHARRLGHHAAGGLLAAGPA